MYVSVASRSVSHGACIPFKRLFAETAGVPVVVVVVPSSSSTDCEGDVVALEKASVGSWSSCFRLVPPPPPPAPPPAPPPFLLFPIVRFRLFTCFSHHSSKCCSCKSTHFVPKRKEC